MTPEETDYRPLDETMYQDYPECETAAGYAHWQAREVYADYWQDGRARSRQEARLRQKENRLMVVLAVLAVFVIGGMCVLLEKLDAARQDDDALTRAIGAAE